MARKKVTEEDVVVGAPTASSIWIPTGSVLTDLVFGGGRGLGIPSGVIANFSALESGFKTFMACEIVAAAYHMFGKNFKWVYDDAESGFTFDTKKLYGFEIMPVSDAERFKSGTVEELFYNIRRFVESLKKGEFGVYVVDSLDGLSSEELDKRADERYKAMADNKQVKGSYQMGSAKFLSQEFFKTLTPELYNKQVLVIIISQLRFNVNAGLYGEKYTRAGGKALDYYAYTHGFFKQISKIVRGKTKDFPGTQVGGVVEVKTKKLKAPRPYRSVRLSFYYDYGLDDIGSSVDYLFDCRGKSGELLKSSSKIVWSKSEQPYTRGELIATIEDDKMTGDGSMAKELRERVIAKWEAYEASIASDRPGKYASKGAWTRKSSVQAEDEEETGGPDVEDEDGSDEEPES